MTLWFPKSNWCHLIRDESFWPMVLRFSILHLLFSLIISILEIIKPLQTSYLATLSICVASSRVGASTTATGPPPRLTGGWCLMCTSAGRMKPSVLPEPVWAMATMFCPDKARGQPIACDDKEWKMNQTFKVYINILYAIYIGVKSQHIELHNV